MASIAESAEKFITAYGKVVESGKAINNLATEAEQDAALDQLCSKILAFRLPGSVAFGVPMAMPQPDDDNTPKMMKAMFRNCIRNDIAAGITLKSHQVRVVYDGGSHGSALVEVVYGWEPLPKSGLKPWDVQTVYGYRKKPSGEEGWEMAYVDGEFAKLMEHVGPKMFEGLGP